MRRSELRWSPASRPRRVVARRRSRLPRHLLERQIGGLGTLKNLSDVSTDIAIGVGQARSITDQAACRDVYAKVIDGRNRVAGSQRHDLLATAEVSRIGDEQSTGLEIDEGSEGGIDIAFGARVQDTKHEPFCARRFLHSCGVALGV